MRYITYPSALDFWLDATHRSDLKLPYRLFSYNPVDCEHSVNGLVIPALPAPVTLLAISHNNHWSNQYYSFSAPPGNLPENSFVLWANDICVACPELCFLLAANHYTLAQLVELGNCLCSDYVYDAASPYNQRQREPITSAEKISGFLINADHCLGVKKARLAAKYIKNHSNSPMENKSAAIFFLSRYHGGYSIKDGELNGSVRLSREGVRLLGTSKCRGDILWEKDSTVFEYDSTLAHEAQDQRQYDSKRQTAMSNSGYKVVKYTAETIHNFGNFEVATTLLMKNLGMRTDLPSLTNNRPTRMKVFKELFIENHPFFRTIDS